MMLCRHVVTSLLIILQCTHAIAFLFIHPLVSRDLGLGGAIIFSQSSVLLELMKDPSAVSDEQRRHLIEIAIASYLCIPDSANARTNVLSSSSGPNININGPHDNLRNYHDSNLPNWQGTALNGMSLREAAQFIDRQSSHSILPMGRWPDPILRKIASPVPLSVFQSVDQLKQLRQVAMALQNTARKEGAVGLAAQQCGVDLSMIFIDGVKEKRNDKNTKGPITGEGKIIQTNKDGGIFLVNPRIIQRSPESAMMVWTEECLVLPPEFRATLLRDASITVEYETLDEGFTKQITLTGELARCAQHEMDHDRGVLIVDHVGLEELPNFISKIEDADKMHQARIDRAYQRYVSESTLLPSKENYLPLACESSAELYSRDTFFDLQISTSNSQQYRPWFVQPALADETSISSTLNKNKHGVNASDQLECDAACMEKRKAIIAERRAMMQQSRSNTNRGDVLKLSEQRARLYGTNYGGLPPKACPSPGYCP